MTCVFGLLFFAVSLIEFKWNNLLRIKIELFCDKEVILGKGYNEYLQAVVYNHLNDKESNWLHENGFAVEKRQFRMFVLSSI